MTTIGEHNIELSEMFLERCTKEQLLELAEKYYIILTRGKKRKEDMLRAVKSQLITKGILVIERGASSA